MAETITAEQFRRAVARSARRKKDLAELLGVDRSMIYLYEQNGVTRPSMVATVRAKMALWLADDEGNPYLGYDDADLLHELERRLAELRMKVTAASDPDEGPESSTTGSSGEPPPSGDEGGTGRYTGTGGPPPEAQ